MGCAALVVVGTNLNVRAGVGGLSHATLDALPARAVAIVPGSPTSQLKVEATLLGRMEGALALYRAGRVQTILVSGVDIQRDPETSAMRRWLEERGVPADHILSDEHGSRTRETMYRAIRYFGVTRAIVCTESLHMPRTLFLARQNGIDAVGFELPSQMSRLPRRVGIELLKTTLALFEETFAPKPRSAPIVASL
jgi:vancomycin permeability regulator SanA